MVICANLKLPQLRKYCLPCTPSAQAVSSSGPLVMAMEVVLGIRLLASEHQGWTIYPKSTLQTLTLGLSKVAL